MDLAALRACLRTAMPFTEMPFTEATAPLLKQTYGCLCTTSPLNDKVLAVIRKIDSVVLSLRSYSKTCVTCCMGHNFGGDYAN